MRIVIDNDQVGLLIERKRLDDEGTPVLVDRYHTPADAELYAESLEDLLAELRQNLERARLLQVWLSAKPGRK